MSKDLFEIIKKINQLGPEGSSYHQHILCTEMRLDQMPQPSDFKMFRSRSARLWLYEGKWLGYDDLFDAARSDGDFPGTYYFEEAINIERWGEDMHDGWRHHGNYQVRWIGEGTWYSQKFTGQELMNNLNNCIYAWNKENDDY